MIAKNEWQLSKLFNKVAFAARFLAILAVIGLLMTPSTYAQNRSAGEIGGTVTDTTGAFIPGAAVTIQNTLTGVITRLTSDRTGVYDAVSLDPGTYTVSFAKEGFKEFIKSNIVLYAEAITVNATLEVGAVTQKVEVRAGVELVQTETSDKRLTLTSDTIEELPSVGQNWMDFTGLLPGVNMGASTTFSYNTPSGWGVGFNGQGGFQMMGLMDGGISTFMSGQEYYSVPIQAIQEVAVNVSNFGAEYSNGLAVFNVIQKSGTNQFHGEAYEYVQNDAFEARNFFSPSVASLRWNMYGGTIGGPIKKDKLFFFFGFQANPTNSFGFGLATYPTAAMREGNLSGLPQAYNPAGLVQNPDGSYSNNSPFPGNQITTIDPVAKAIMGYYPNPNQPGFYNNDYYTISNPSSKYSYNGKVTYNISSGNRLNVSEFLQSGNIPTNLYNGPTCPIDCYSQGTFSHNDVITDVWSLTPNTVNEFRAGVLSNHDPYTMGDVGKNWGTTLNIPNLTANAFPGISIGGTGAPTSIGNSFKHALLAYASISIGDSLSLVRGKHILKFGGEYNSGRDNQSWGDINAGDFSFTGQFTANPQNPTATGLGFADFLLGAAGTWSDSWTPAWGSRIGSTQFFGQDDFKVTPKLTLNIGLRWLIERGITEQFNRLGSFDPTIENPATGTLGAMWYGGQDGRKASEATLWNNLQPRIGFAWAPKNNWSVRGSFGIFDNMWTNTYYGGGIGLGMGVSGYDYAPNSLIPVYTNGQSSELDLGHTPPAIPTFPPGADFYNGSSVVYYPYHTPMTYIQQWHLSVQHQFKGDVMVELGYVGSRGVHLSNPSDLDQVPESAIQQYGGIGVNMQPYRPYPNYTGINYQAFGGWNNYNALQLTVKKAVSKGLWALSNYTWSHSLDTNTQNGWIAAESDYQIALSPRSLYGNSQIDARQAWNGGFVYQLPFGQGKTLLNQGGVLNGVVGGWQLSNTWQASDGEPFSPVWGGPNDDFSGSGTWYPNRVCNGKVSHPTISEWFNPACFVAATPGTYGNSGRDILSGPGYFNMNTSLSKSFKLPHLGEQSKLQIRMDVIDVLNHPNFGSVQTGVTPAPTSAGVISSAISNRNLQLGARIVF